MNHNYILDQNPKLITGISDFVQVYASHATFIYKSLLSINLKIINTAPFKVDQFKIRILHTQGVDIFPQNTNPSYVLIEELNSMAVKKVNFCLNVEVVEPLSIWFEISSMEEIKFRSLPYKIGI